MQQIVNAAPTAGEGARLRRMTPALVTAGIEAGYLTNPRLKEVHWQAGDRPLPAPAGEHRRGIRAVRRPRRDPRRRRHRQARPGTGRRTARGPGRADGQYRRLQRAAVGRAVRPDHRPGRHRPPVSSPWTARSSRSPGTCTSRPPRAASAAAPSTPPAPPAGYPLADPIAARIQQARAEQDAGTNPLGLMFPSPRGRYWRSSNFDRRVLAARLPGRRVARRRRQRHLDLAQPAARVLHHRAVLLAPRRHRRVLHGRPRQRTASPSTCTSAPPQASWTAPAQPPNSAARTATQ